MYFRISIVLLCCFVYCLAQSAKPNCDDGLPVNVKVVPSQCCNITHIFAKELEQQCISKYQNVVSNVNRGIKGKFDGLECFFSCLLNGTGAYQNGAINVQAIKAAAASRLNNDNVWIPVVNSAIDFCIQKVNSNKAALDASMGTKPIADSTDCSPVGAYFLSCVYFSQLRDCPATAQINKQNNECAVLRDYYKACPTLPLHKPNGQGQQKAPGQQGPNGQNRPGANPPRAG